jgi:HK97 family phage prohead protease
VSASTLLRAFPTDIEVRADQRVVSGIAVPYDQETEIWEKSGRHFREVFRFGAFAKSIRDRGSRVKLLALHDQQGRFALGKAISLKEDPRGLLAEFQLSNTRDADEVLNQIREGTLTDLSIGFQPVKDRWNRARTLVERLEAKLIEVSVVNVGAYEGAVLTGTRAAQTDGTPAFYMPRAQAQARAQFLRMKYTHE